MNNLGTLTCSLGLIICAGIVITSKYAVLALLFLVLCFIFSSFLLFFLECEFLALIFMVIYVGAIAVLFLFAVMMLNSKKINLLRNSIKYVPAGFLIIGLSFLTPLLNVLLFNSNNIISPIRIKNQKLEILNNNLNLNSQNFLDSVFHTDIYGQILYTYFVLELLVAGLLLLAVIIGVVYFTNTFNSKQSSGKLAKVLTTSKLKKYSIIFGRKLEGTLNLK